MPANVWEELSSDLVIYRSMMTINAADKETMLSQRRKGAKNIGDDYNCVRVEAKLRLNEHSYTSRVKIIFKLTSY